MSILVALLSKGQSSTPSIIGLNFQNSTLTPVSVLPSTGFVQSLKQPPTSQDAFNSGNSCVNNNTSKYYYLRGNPMQ
jgi:hypothetical protein